MLQFDDRFDFGGDVFGKGAHSHSASRSNAIVLAKHIRKQLAKPINHLGLLREIGRAIHHAQGFDHAVYTLEVAKGR